VTVASSARRRVGQRVVSAVSASAKRTATHSVTSTTNRDGERASPTIGT
jgi:hypothetical protein